MTTEEDEVPSTESRHESQHEFNFFLDKEIQNKLLSLEEAEDEEEIQKNSGYPQNTEQYFFKPTTKNTSVGLLGRDSFCAWCQDPIIKQRKQEKTTSKKDVPPFKDYRPKDIAYTFSHYTDRKRYIDQYRREHTYSYGLMGREVMGLHRLAAHSQGPNRNGLSRFQLVGSETVPVSLASQPSHTQSEVSLLELNESRSSTNDRKIPTTKYSEIVQCDSIEVPRKGSATKTRSSPLSLTLTSSKITTVAPSATKHGGSLRTSPKQMLSPILSGPAVAPHVFQGKIMKPLPSNGYSMGNQAISRSVSITGNQSPRLVIPQNSVRTMDILSHVSVVDRQMWFDASGRAYVSLATRYEPVRK